MTAHRAGNQVAALRADELIVVHVLALHIIYSYNFDNIQCNSLDNNMKLQPLGDSNISIG